MANYRDVISPLTSIISWGSSMLSVELTEEVNNRLELLSLSTGRTMEYYLVEAIKEYLEDAETRSEEMDHDSNNYFSFAGATECEEDYGFDGRP